MQPCLGQASENSEDTARFPRPRPASLDEGGHYGCSVDNGKALHNKYSPTNPDWRDPKGPPMGILAEVPYFFCHRFGFLVYDQQIVMYA